MKAGIITFQETNNYGAVLQNYALQQAILKCGAEPETIDYLSDYIGRPYRLTHLKNKGLLAYLYGIVGFLIYRMREKNTNFFRKHIRYSERIVRKQLATLNERYAVFITGSDQVFNHRLTGGDATYLLDFVTDKKRCSSYAASLGLENVGEAFCDAYKACLKDFRVISVREKTASAALKELLERDIAVVSDPCALLTCDEWRRVAVLPKERRAYVLVYELGISPEVVSLAKQIASSENLKIIFVPFPIGIPAKGSWKPCAGPGELLGLIAQAEYVITDSFHGTLLSIIFEKPFFTRIPEKRVGSRILDLLKEYDLEDRLIGSCIDYKKAIDYRAVREKIAQNRTYSMELLKKCVSEERTSK